MQGAPMGQAGSSRAQATGQGAGGYLQLGLVGLRRQPEAGTEQTPGSWPGDGLWLLGVDAPGSGAGPRADSLLWTQVSFLILEAFTCFPTSSAIHANRFLGSFSILEVLDQEGGSRPVGHIAHKVSSDFSHRACFCPPSSSLPLPAVSLSPGIVTLEWLLQLQCAEGPGGGQRGARPCCRFR